MPQSNDIAAEVRRSLHSKWSLIPAALRAEWDRHQMRENRRGLIALTLISLASYLLFALADGAMYPSIGPLSWKVRISFALVCLPLIVWLFTRIRQIRVWDLVLLVMLVSGAALSFIPIMSHDGPISSGYITASTAYIAVISLAVMTRFLWMVFGIGMISVMVFFFMRELHESRDQALIEYFAAFLPIHLFLLYTGGIRLRTARRNFLHRQLALLEYDALNDANRVLQNQADTDPLTGVGNRRAFDKIMAGFADAPAGRDYALLLIDIDYFKQYNDHYGHQAGDACLQAITDIVQKRLREEGSMLFRIGGEEFVAIVEGVPVAAMQALVDRLVQAVEAKSIAHENRASLPKLVTISVGASICTAGQMIDPHAWFKQTDDALYQAKLGGRNRGHVHHALPANAA
ncbi:MAG: diguanylate cyclase [Pseudomonadota bacterium]|nr:diguanylate cyclase [Pseudomonadota bacterium]